MNAYKLSVAGINVNEGIKRFNGNSALYERLLKKFPCNPNYDAMCAAISAGDAKAAFTAAHTLKGTAGNLSIARLYEDIYPLVELLRGGSLDNVEELLSPVTKDYQEILAALAEND